MSPQSREGEELRIPGFQTNQGIAIAKFLLVTSMCLIIAYFFPRFLTHHFGEGSPWTSYFYLYGFGLIFFGIGIWVALHSGACQPGRGRDSFWLKFLILGYIGLASLHGIWIQVALSIPFLGE